MQWLEIITCRTSEPDPIKIVKDFIRPITDHATDQGLIRIKIFNHVILETDLSIHLYWNNDPPVCHTTPLGFQLTEVLENFGLIVHSSWVESGTLGKKLP